MMTPSSPTASEQIADFSTSFDYDDLAPAALLTVGRAIVDTVGVAIAGAGESASAIAADYVSKEGGTPAVTTWGQSVPFSLTGAAFYNGVAAHVLDFDDVSSPLRGHPSVAMLPALLALGQARGTQGRRLASAYAVGLEVMVRLARVLVSDHYTRGWHATATLGMLGATVACSHLLGLSARQTVNAIGLAVAQCAGTRANFGSMAKSFQTGHCNTSALRSALLAEAGMDAAADALDGPQGFAVLYGNGEPLAASLETLGKASPEIISSGLEIKKYPMCYAAHRSIDGVLDLRQEHGLEAEDIAAIHVQSNYRAMVPLIHPRAQTGLEAKFSMPYAMAAALLDGHVRLASFTDEAVQRNAIQALMKKVTTEEAAGAATPRWNRIRVTLRNGTVHGKEIRTLRGSHENPLSNGDLLEKWNDCLEYGGHADTQSRFFNQALAVETDTVATLMSLLPQPSVAAKSLGINLGR